MNIAGVDDFGEWHRQLVMLFHPRIGLHELQPTAVRIFRMDPCMLALGFDRDDDPTVCGPFLEPL